MCTHLSTIDLVVFFSSDSRPQLTQLALTFIDPRSWPHRYQNCIGTVVPWELVEKLRANLKAKGLLTTSLRLEGSCAAHCLNSDAVPVYVRSHA